MKQYALFLSPTGQSLSPQIHHILGQLCHIPLHYRTIGVLPADFEQALADFRAQGGVGANVTMPHKTQAYRLCDKLTARAKLAQSVNTLYWENDLLCGDTTDGVGFIASLGDEPQLSLTGKTLLLLGAGGAAASILGAILAQDPHHVYIANRTPLRAVQLASRFPGLVSALPINTLNSREIHFDWIINATPLSSYALDFPLQASKMKDVVWVDLSYQITGKPTALAAWAMASGAQRSIDGLGMLVAQAVASFNIWHPGANPDPKCVLAALINLQGADGGIKSHHES